jgi:hypothetical protein
MRFLIPKVDMLGGRGVRRAAHRRLVVRSGANMHRSTPAGAQRSQSAPDVQRC